MASISFIDFVFPQFAPATWQGGVSVFHAGGLQNLQVFGELVSARVKTGIGENYEGYPCRWCDYKEVCYEKKDPIKTCRSCEHSKPFTNGDWLCTLKNQTLTLNAQLAACESYAQKGK